MIDPTERALEHARGRADFPSDGITPMGPNGPDYGYNRVGIRMPEGRRPTMAQRGDVYLPFDSRPKTLDLTGVKTTGLDDAQKDELLDTLLDGYNSHTERARDLELESDAVTLENKKRFSKLGYSLAKYAGITFLLTIVAFVGLTVYGTIFDKAILETGLFSVFLNTFVEMAKIIFSVF